MSDIVEGRKKKGFSDRFRFKYLPFNVNTQELTDNNTEIHLKSMEKFIFYTRVRNMQIIIIKCKFYGFSNHNLVKSLFYVSHKNGSVLFKEKKNYSMFRLNTAKEMVLYYWHFFKWV